MSTNKTKDFVEVPIYYKLVDPDTLPTKRPFASRVQLTGWRFQKRRVSGGLTDDTSSSGMLSLIIHQQMGLLGAVLGALGIIVCLVIAMIHPQSTIKENSIFRIRNHDGLYVLLHGVIHPVFNLTSARLIVGKPLQPVTVTPNDFAKFPLGARIGIVDAPFEFNSSNIPGAWQVCSANDHTTVLHTTAIPVDHNEGFIVQNHYHFWLIWNGNRSFLPRLHNEVLRALGVSPLKLANIPSVTDEFLNTLHKRPPYIAPHIDAYGAKPEFTIHVFPEINQRLRVGTIIKGTPHDAPVRYFLTLPRGIQEIPVTVAALFLALNPHSLYAIPDIDMLYALPFVHYLDLTGYPAAPLHNGNENAHKYLCSIWTRSFRDKPAGRFIITTDTLAHGSEIAQNSRISTLFAPPVGDLIQLDDNLHTMLWLSPQGVMFPVDDETFRALNITATPILIPWQVAVLYTRSVPLTRTFAVKERNLL